MEAFVLVLLFVVVIAFFRKISNFVYSVAIVDILLRILDFIKYNINVKEVSTFISKYFPSNMPAIIDKYTDGVFSDILMWGYVLIMAVFEFYIIRQFFKNKKL